MYIYIFECAVVCWMFGIACSMCGSLCTMRFEIYVYLHILKTSRWSIYISYACILNIYVTSLIFASILKYRGSKHFVGTSLIIDGQIWKTCCLELVESYVKCIFCKMILVILNYVLISKIQVLDIKNTSFYLKKLLR